MQAKFVGRSDVLYTDTAEYYTNKTAHIAVVARESGDPVSCCTVKNTSATEAEVAIALAIAHSGTRVVVSDCKAAIKNYDVVRVSAAAAKAPREGEVPAEQISLIWCPVHRGLWGNEKAHTTARGLTFRSIEADSLPRREEHPSGDELRTFQEIISHCKLGPDRSRSIQRRINSSTKKSKLCGGNCKPGCSEPSTVQKMAPESLIIDALTAIELQTYSAWCGHALPIPEQKCRILGDLIIQPHSRRATQSHWSKQGSKQMPSPSPF